MFKDHVIEIFWPNFFFVHMTVHCIVTVAQCRRRRLSNWIYSIIENFTSAHLHYNEKVSKPSGKKIPTRNRDGMPIYCSFTGLQSLVHKSVYYSSGSAILAYICPGSWKMSLSMVKTCLVYFISIAHFKTSGVHPKCFTVKVKID